MFLLRLRIGRPTPTRFSQCYKSLQRTASHLKKCLLKDTSFVPECKNRESLTIIVGQLFGSSQKGANLNRLPESEFTGHTRVWNSRFKCS